MLANANSKDLQSCLRVAGLHRNKAKTIKNLSRTILKKYHADLKPILSMPVEEARTELMKIHGIGPKTADVVLLFCARQDTIPVDTHVNRVSKRLGLAPLIGDYETVRKALQGIYDSKEYMQVHLQFISLGRNYCKAKSPLCKECPIEMFCPSRDIWDKNQLTTQASRKVQKVKLRR